MTLPLPSTPFTERLGLRHPIVQAPMAGGPTTPELVAAVSEAGGLGNIGGAYMGVDALRDAIHRVRALTDRPFGVNLFARLPGGPPRRNDTVALDRALTEHRRAAGLTDPDPDRGQPEADLLDAQLDLVVEERVPVFSFTFGLIDPQRFHEAGSVVLGTATTVDEARALVEAGVDGVVAQGAEAGGHRGSFRAPFDVGQIGTIALVPQVVDAIDVPVIAAGGIADGRGVAAALTLGASAAALGTAFLACPESGAPEPYKRAVREADETSTTITDRFTGRPARAIRNGLLNAIEGSGVPPAPFPAQGSLLADLRAAGIENDDPELLVMYSGQAARLATNRPAGELVGRLAAEAAARRGDVTG